MTAAITHMEIAEITKEMAKSFDYRSLAPDDANEAKAAAVRIRNRAKAAIIETGQDLIAIKERLGHGNFGRWLDAEFGMTQRTAQNYMNAAEVFGAKSEVVSHLPAAEVYRLASPSTPASVREKVVQSLEAGRRVESYEIRHLLKSAIDAEESDTKHKKKIEKLPPKKRETREEAWERIKAEDAQRREEHIKAMAQAQTDAAKAYAMLTLYLGEKAGEFVALLRKCDQPTLYKIADGDQVIPVDLPVSLIQENGEVALPPIEKADVAAEVQMFQEGRQKPITVVAVSTYDEEGRPCRRWQVVEGRARLQAAERLKLETILSVVTTDG